MKEKKMIGLKIDEARAKTIINGYLVVDPFTLEITDNIYELYENYVLADFEDGVLCNFGTGEQVAVKLGFEIPVKANVETSVVKDDQGNLTTGVYLMLFHGRKEPDEKLDDWGFNGPVLGPFPYVHTTYASLIHTGDASGDDIQIHGDMIYYDGAFYGDWSVYTDVSEIIKTDGKRIQKFDPEKARIPEKYNTPRKDLYIELINGPREKGNTEWGKDGPVLGPFEFVAVTGNGNLRVDDFNELQVVDGGVRYDGIVYRDWSVISVTKGIDEDRLQEFDPKKASK